ncbi:hypothetical protein [Acetobacter malorum]|uniref:hypothetical protein n=1 Tax=Acetobacter malorum TaxID=178901 RepID=UPI00248DECF3|nr:hypothetical protein [Acetobacter malorum]
MRTREEQIAAAFPNGDTGLALMYQGDFTIHILEAERRAEQRVRAEIGRDSERLDWVADNQCQFENSGLGDKPLRRINDCMGDTLASDYDLREAIDAARENAND